MYFIYFSVAKKILVVNLGLNYEKKIFTYIFFGGDNLFELKKWEVNNLDDLIVLCNSVDKKFLRNRIPTPYKKNDASSWLKNVFEIDGKTGLFRAIFIEEKIIGSISLEMKNDVYRKTAEIGYMILNEYSGKGIITAAIKKICEMGFNNLDIIRIEAKVVDKNIASRKVLEKNNFVLEGILKNAVWKNNEIYNLCIYGLIK